jgi:hypothetical protein
MFIGQQKNKEGNVGYKSVPRLQHLLLPHCRSFIVDLNVVKGVFCGQIS